MASIIKFWRCFHATSSHLSTPDLKLQSSSKYEHIAARQASKKFDKKLIRTDISLVTFFTQNEKI